MDLSCSFEVLGFLLVSCAVGHLQSRFAFFHFRKGAIKTREHYTTARIALVLETLLRFMPQDLMSWHLLNNLINTHALNI